MKKILMVAITLIASVSVFGQEYGTSSEWGYKPSNSEVPSSPLSKQTIPPAKTTVAKSTPEIIESMFENGKYKEFVVVVDCQNKTKTEIYTALKLWYGKTFKAAKEVIQSDVAGEVIVGVGNSVIGGVRYKYEITTLIKDNKFKTSISFRELNNASGAVQYFPPLEDFYTDWKNKKAGFFCKTGSMEFKESVLVGIYIENNGIVEGMKKEINNYDSF